jgi:hypothetical protein
MGMTANGRLLETGPVIVRPIEPVKQEEKKTEDIKLKRSPKEQQNGIS